MLILDKRLITCPWLGSPVESPPSRCTFNHRALLTCLWVDSSATTPLRRAPLIAWIPVTMAFASVNMPGPEAFESPMMLEESNKATYKSFKSGDIPCYASQFQAYTITRKKFLKMRHTFKEKMRESNALFDEEQHAIKLARRLQEQNE